MFYLTNKEALTVYYTVSEKTRRAFENYGVTLRTKINLKNRSDLLGEINSEIKNIWSNN